MTRFIEAHDPLFDACLAHPDRLLAQALEEKQELCLRFSRQEFAQTFFRRLCSANRGKRYKDANVFCYRHDANVFAAPHATRPAQHLGVE